MAADSLAEGLRFHQAGQFSEAEVCYRGVLKEDPSHVESAFLLGTLLLQAGRASDAIVFLQRVVDTNPAHATARNNLALAFFAVKNFDSALAHFQSLAEDEPDNWIYHYRIASCSQELKHTDTMLLHMQRVLALNPLAPEARECIAATLTGRGHFITSACFIEKWSRLPGWSETTRILMAEALAKGNLFAAANQLLEQELSNNLRYWHIKAYVSHQQQRFNETIDAYQRIQELKPKDALSLTNLGVVKLTLGQMEEGWRYFDARFHPGGPLHNLKVDAPEWDGRPLNGETVLVHSEQGFGDVIQFMRFFPRIEAAGGRLLFTSYPDVIQLLKTQQGAIAYSNAGQFDLSYQWQIPLLSLGKIYANNLDALPIEPYVAANPERIDIWAARLGVPQGLRVGLVWAGSPGHGNDANRSAALDDFAPLGDVPGTHFFGLQKGPSEGQALFPPEGLEIINLSSEIHDFADTAAILSELDLLICVDTSVAHLAGALGKPVWVLLPTVFDWRWLQNREDSPWYPSMRLFRLRAEEVWADLMLRVRTALIEFSRAKTQEAFSEHWSAFDRWMQKDELSALEGYIKTNGRIPFGLLSSPSFKKESLYNSAVEMLHDNPFALGVLQSAYGCSDEALSAYKRISNNDAAEVCRSLRAQAALYSLQGNATSLLQIAEEGTARFPACQEFIYWRGQARRLLGCWEDAAADYQQMLNVAPRNVKAMINLAYCLGQLQKSDDALMVLEKAVQSNPRHELAWQQLALLLDNHNAVQVSKFVSEHITRLFPNSVPALLRQSVARSRCGEVELAKKDIERALELDPTMPDHVFYQATVYAMEGSWGRAIPLFEQVIREFPDNHNASMWVAQHFLRSGQWQQGWVAWERRLNDGHTDSVARALPQLDVPRWDGSPLEGRTLLVLCDQGFGDTLNFLHFLEYIEGCFVLVVQDGLLALCQQLNMRCQVLARTAARQALPRCDVAIELLSLPFVLQLGGKIAPPSPAYVVPELKGQRLLNRLDDLSGLRVGIVWAGNPSHGDTHLRDCPFEQMAQLLNVQGIAWCSLQKDEASNQVLFIPGAAERLTNIAPELETWLDTATILSQLDLVITVDTALAHLASSMGRPVWLLLSKRNDWRWGDTGEATIWYPSMRLFRQRTLNDWAELMLRVRMSLEDWVEGVK